MTASRKQIKEMADLLISTLSTTMPSENADAIVRDVAEGLYRDVLGMPGRIVVDQSQATGYLHGGFGKNGRRAAIALASYKFEPEKQQ